MSIISYRNSNNKISGDYVPKVKVMDSAGNQLSIRVVNGDCDKWECRDARSNGIVFQSYGSNVAYIRNSHVSRPSGKTHRVYLYKPYWNMYSQTTNRYLLEFLGETSIADVRKKVESGFYIEMS